MADHQPIIVRKKKVVGGHGHHGGSWKVAYADFVTAMMAFFMVMWIMGLSTETRSNIQGYFSDPLGFVKNTPKSKSIMSLPGSPNAPGSQKNASKENAGVLDQKEMKNVEQALKSALEGETDIQTLLKDVHIQITDEGLLIELLETRGAVFFQSGSAQMTDQARTLVKKIGFVLARSGRKMSIQGHTDAQPYAGNPNGNWELSTERALALQQVLTQSGVTEKQVKEVSGFGSTRLLEPDKPLASSNRRVTILLPRVAKEGETVSAPSDGLRAAIKSSVGAMAVEVKPQETGVRAPIRKEWF